VPVKSAILWSVTACGLV